MFQRMCFGLCNASSTFARLMNHHVLRRLVWKICLVYLDDVIIYAPNFDEYLIRIREVLDRLKQSNLKLKPKKCTFGQTRIKFLGHIVTPEGVNTDPNECQVIQDFPLKHLRSFLGLANNYSRFVKHFREFARPLYRLTRKGIPFVWTADCQTAFEKNQKSSSVSTSFGISTF